MVLLPLPLTPVITLKASRGIERSMFLRLCSRACRMTMALSVTPGSRLVRPARGAAPAAALPAGLVALERREPRRLRSATPVLLSAHALDLGGRPVADDTAARLSALGTQVDDPVRGADDVEVVLDDHHGVTRVHELAERAEERGDVVEVQARGGLVEEEQRPLLRRRAVAVAVFRPEVPGELQPLRLAAAQRGYGLARGSRSPGRRRPAARAPRRMSGDPEKNSHASVTVMSSTSATDFPAGWTGPGMRRRGRGARPAPPSGSAGRRSPGSAGTRRSGTASRCARSRCRCRSGSGRCPS